MQDSYENLTALYKVIVEELPVPVCLYSIPDYKVLLANNAILEIWNKDQSIIGKTRAEIFPEDHSYNFQSILEEVATSREKITFKEFPLSFSTKDGGDRAYFFDITYSPVKDANLNVVAIMKTMVDVTEQVEKTFQFKELQEFNQRTLNDSEIGTFDIDIKNKKIWLDRVALKLTGFDENQSGQQELSGQLETYIHPEDLPVLQKEFQKAVDPEIRNLYSTKYRTVNDEGKLVYWVHSIGKAYFNKENQATRLTGIIKDISNEIKIVNESTQMLSLIENSIQYMAISGINGKMVYMNKYGRDFIGIKEDEDISKYHIKDFYTPYHYQEAQEKIIPSIKESGKWTGTIFLKHLKTEEILPCQANFVTIINEHTGEPIARGVTLKDLRSDIHQIKKLAESEDRFRRIIEQSPMAIMILRGEDFKIEMANPKMLEYIKRDRSYISKNILNVLPEINKQHYPELLKKVYQNGKPYFGYGEKTLIMDKGIENELYFNYVFSPLTDAEGTVNGLAVVANEVTSQVKVKEQLERSEKHFRSLILDAPFPTSIYMGKDLIINVANEAMLKLWGKDSSVIGKKLELALPELEGQPFIGLLNEVFETGNPYHTERQKANLVVDGKLQSFWFNFTYKPLFNEKNEVYAILNMAVDITTQVNLQQQKDEFIGIASHELKTPVTTIKAYVQLLESMLRTEGEDEKANLMLKLDKQVSRLNELISELLDVTKIHSGSIEFNYTSFDFNEMVTETVEDLQQTTTKNKIIVDLNEVGYVFSDRNRLGQVVSNLLSNAIKYSPDPTEIIVKTLKTKNNTIQFSVQDFGIGINPTKLNKVFEQFYRTDDNKQYTFPGLGLGLYISSEIIKKEEGKIWVDSEEGEGSTFYFEIPLNRED